MKRILIFIVLLLMGGYRPACAGEADVVEVEVVETARGTYQFQVSVRHQDRGWEHYADRWEILDENGVVLGTRVLYHPHVEEQPFSRSLSGVEIPENIRTVTVRAHDSVDGYGGRTISVKIP